MALPKRRKVYSEARSLADAWKRGEKATVVAQATRSGPSRCILPALIYHHLLEMVSPKESSLFLKAIVDATVRD